MESNENQPTYIDPNPGQSVQEQNPSPQKPKSWKSLIFAIILLAVLVTGSVIFLFFSPKSTQAQVQSLVNLYFEVDHVRTDSAQIFAEFIEIQRSPERVGNGTQEIGEKPYLTTRDELLRRISVNRDEVRNVISIIQSEEFSTEEVKEAHVQLEEFYKNLFEFEDKVIEGLEGVESEKEFSKFVSDIFEDKNNLPAVLENDTKLRDALVILAEKNNVKFANASYLDEYKQKSIELDTSKIDLTKFGQAKEQFTIPEDFIQANISVATGTGLDISDLAFGLRHDDTGKVINFMISENALEGEDDSVLINNLPQSDTNENVTATIIPSESYPAFFYDSINYNARVNYGRYYLMITLYPDDPILSPVHGDWTMFVLGPAGGDIVIGASSL